MLNRVVEAQGLLWHFSPHFVSLCSVDLRFCDVDSNTQYTRSLGERRGKLYNISLKPNQRLESA